MKLICPLRVSPVRIGRGDYPNAQPGGLLENEVSRVGNNFVVGFPDVYKEVSLVAALKRQ